MAYGIAEPTYYRANPGFENIYQNLYDFKNSKLKNEYNAAVEKAKKQETLIQDFQTAQDEANAANESRYNQGLGIYDQMESSYAPGGEVSATEQMSRDLMQKNIDTYNPGGAYEQGAKATYDVGARQARGNAYQGLVSSGMSNISGSYDLQAAKDKGLFGLQLEGQRTGLQTGARNTMAGNLSSYDLQRRQALERTQTGKLGWIERREDAAPDPNLLAQLIEQGASAYA